MSRGGGGGGRAGGAISTVPSDIYVCKMEEDIVISANPIFYKRYVDDTCV